MEVKVLAMVNNQPITSYELKNKILTQIILSNQTIDQKTIDKSKNVAMNFLINMKLKEIEIKKKRIEIDYADVQKALLNLSSNDIVSFEKKFSQNSIDYELFKKEIKTELSWQRLIYTLYNDKVKIDEKLVDEELKQILSQRQNSVEFDLSEIEIEVNNENRTSLINQVLEDIKTLGFGVSAKKWSISPTALGDGKLGWVNLNALSPQIMNILKGLKINEVSKPIVKQGNVLFLKINDKKKEIIKKEDLENLRKRIIDQKTNEMFRLYSNSYISKLKNNSFIEFK
jgi:peptidyl-prolyl cis-trans isomerase SurA